MKSVVVLALPRSGSSLLSGILHRLGVDMGSKKDMNSGKFFNKYGCYENYELFDLNREILYHSGSLGGWNDIPNNRRLKKTVKAYKSRIKKTIRKYEKNLWGWKDPFITHSIPYFHNYLNNPHYIFLKREVDKVVNSQLKLMNLKDFKIEKFYPEIDRTIRLLNPFQLIRMGLRWIRDFLIKGDIFNKFYIKRITRLNYWKLEKFVKDKQHLKIHFEYLIKNPRGEINRIIEFLNINPSEEQKLEALRFVHPEIVHF